MINLETETKIFQVEETAHTDMCNRSVCVCVCVCFSLFCLKKNYNDKEIWFFFFFWPRTSPWTLLLFTAWNSMTLLQNSLGRKKMLKFHVSSITSRLMLAVSTLLLSIFKFRNFYSQSLSSPQMLSHLAWDSSISQFT